MKDTTASGLPDIVRSQVAAMEAWNEAERKSVVAGWAIALAMGQLTFEELEERLAAAMRPVCEENLARERTHALSSDRVTYAPGSPDKRLVRELGRRLDSGRAFTDRQVRVAAYLAWRYRRQINADLVPSGPMPKP